MLPVRRDARELMSIRDMFDRFFEDSLLGGSGAGLQQPSRGGILLDIYDEGDEIKVKASVPGIDANDLHVEVQDDVLHIWGETRSEKEQKEENYYLREHRFGRVERKASLPYPVQSDKASAEFENGLLTLTLPKDVEARRREIKVQAKK